MSIQDKKKESIEVTRDTLIGDLIKMKPESIDTLLRFGMGCIACPASLNETIEEACMVHGMDPEFLLERLNQ
ncbi:MAG: DUF1858 domain-containing protein [Tissierellia bacterium]|nr:DUF1858 domain-containing protein [Tissierellia bacterium]